MYQSVHDNFITFTTQFEGRVKWMYLDIKGLVSTGIGNLIDPVSLALPLPWVHNSDGASASQTEITNEWNKVKGDQSLAQKGYKAAAPPYTSLHLTDDQINQLVMSKLSQFEATLKKTTEFANLDSWPADAQLGLFSMAWAMGPGFGPGWPSFRAACAAQDWAGAAKNGHMNDTHNPGLRPRNQANVLLFTNAQAVKDQVLDYSVLHWPNAVSAGTTPPPTTAPPSTPPPATAPPSTPPPATTPPSTPPPATAAPATPPPATAAPATPPPASPPPSTPPPPSAPPSTPPPATPPPAPDPAPTS
jgi:GH24 family phage-related lysozyme (muramidase)